MDANELLKLGTDSQKWFDLTKHHWTSARLLAEKASDCIPRSKGGGLTNRLSRDWIEVYESYAGPAHLLYGYALETLLKGQIILTKPADVRFDIVADASNNIVSATLRGFGNSGWHSLESLAKVAGQHVTEDDREMFAHFSDAIVWTSKYPIPKKSSEEEVKRNTLYATRDAEQWLVRLHPEPLPAYPAAEANE